MADKHHKLVYALKNNEIIYISEVESGLKCGCVCPSCGEKLVAKKGERMMHHFAHYSGVDCEYGYETSLHLVAKDILLNAKELSIPPVYVGNRSYQTRELVNEAKIIKVDRVELEKKIDDIVPDVVVYSGKKRLIIEVYVTHKIDENKLSKIKKADISTIEIDLSKESQIITKNELSEILLKDNDKKTWKYNSLSRKIIEEYLHRSKKLKIVERGLAVHVDNCPEKRRRWRGKYYANVFDDCVCCEHCVRTDENYVFCLGGCNISSFKDLYKIKRDEK